MKKTRIYGKRTIPLFPQLIKIMKMSLILIFVFATQAATAQQNVVKGTVSDKSGEPLLGVSVIEKGTTNGTITNADGEYTIQVSSADATLSYSFIGYLSEEVQVAGQTSLNLTMMEDITKLEEVVVIGYGAVKRKDLTGSVGSVSDKDFKDKALTSISQALVGRVAGLDIVSKGNNPGEGAQILLRGKRSIVAKNDPYYILDGLPFYGSLNDINPYDVASIDVLKDASSTAIYGSQGANGVIIITTKRGSVSKAQFSMESSAGIVKVHGLLPEYNGAEFAERGREAYRAAGTYPNDGQIHDDYDQRIFNPIEYQNMLAGNSVNYQDMLVQNGFQQKHQLAVSGGSESVKYNFAGSIYDEEGIIPSNKFDRYSLRSNLDFKISPKINVGSSVMLQYNIRSKKISDASYEEALYSSPLGSPFDADGKPVFDPNNDGYRKNPLADKLWDSYRYNNKRWSAYTSVYAEYKILPSLTYRLNLGASIENTADNTFEGQYSVPRRGDINRARVYRDNNTNKTYESILTFNKKINVHNVQLTGVHSILAKKWESGASEVNNIPYDLAKYNNIGAAETIKSVESNMNETYLISYVGRVNYGYKEKYLLQLTMRADGASQFSENNKWGYFPSASVAWRISEEKFLKSFEWLSNLKVRFGYGVSGNRGIEPYQTQGGLTQTKYSWGETEAAFGQRPKDLANKNLKWESTRSYDLGIDFGFLKNRINGNVDWYNTDTYDLLMYRQIPVTTGFETVLQNVGATNNKGIEISINTVNIDNKRFKWNTTLNTSVNREKIVELYNGKVDDIGNNWYIGHPIQVFYDYKKIGIWQLGEEQEAALYKAKPGQIKLLDAKRDSAITDADRMIIGSREPKFVFNITNSFVLFNNWDLSFDVYVRWGQTTNGWFFSRESQNRLNSLKLDYWTPTNPTNKQPRPDASVQSNTYGGTLAYMDGSFIKLRQLTVGYSIPGTLLNKLKISKARLYLTGDNLWYWTKTEDIKHFNLEPDNNNGLLWRPSQFSIIGGVNITF